MRIDHELKNDPLLHEMVECGAKTVELRRDDRGYKEEQVLMLRKTLHTGAEMAEGAPLVYTGDVAVVQVLSIVRGPDYGVQEGWVAMSVQLLFG